MVFFLISLLTSFKILILIVVFLTKYPLIMIKPIIVVEAKTIISFCSCAKAELNINAAIKPGIIGFWAIFFIVFSPSNSSHWSGVWIDLDEQYLAKEIFEVGFSFILSRFSIWFLSQILLKSKKGRVESEAKRVTLCFGPIKDQIRQIWEALPLFIFSILSEYRPFHYLFYDCDWLWPFSYNHLAYINKFNKAIGISLIYLQDYNSPFCQYLSCTSASASKCEQILWLRGAGIWGEAGKQTYAWLSLQDIKYSCSTWSTSL